MTYVYRDTYRQDEDTYVENRGYPYPIRRGDPNFETLDSYFGDLIAVGQSAIHQDSDGWNVIDGFPLLDDAKERKLKRLRDLWLEAEEGGILETEYGFSIDANPRAMRDITGLLTWMEAKAETEAEFCASDDTLHTVTYDQVKQMQLGVINLCQKLYSKKWALRAAIKAAQNFEELNAIHLNLKED